MKIKNLLLVCSLFLAGGVVATAGEQANSVDAAVGDSYRLVTSVADLTAGDEVIIVAAKANYAMSTNQKTNNRGAVAITKDNDTISYVDNLQVLTLKPGSSEGTFGFYTGSGYLYAASSSKNYLKTTSTLNANGSWNISISSGVATIKSTGSNTRNLLKYNNSDAKNLLFSCYASGQQDIAIYEKVVDASSYNVSLDLAGGLYNGDIVYTANTGESVDVYLPNVDEITAPYSDVVDNMVFDGWYDSSNERYEFGWNTFSEGTTLTAVFHPEGLITVEEALAVCEKTGNVNCPYTFTVQALVKSIDTAYSSQYDNITITLTDGTNSISCYRLKGGEDIKVGDTLQVTGTLINYSSNTPQFTAGATYEKVVLQTYEVMFDANNGSFVDGKGETIVKNTGELAEGTLPTAEDMNLPFASITSVELVGWTDGINTYAPGAAYSVEGATVFSAVYEALEEITIVQALAICEEAGNDGTSFEFTTKGEVKSVDTAYDSSYKNITVTITDGENSIKCFRLKASEGADASTLAVGDYIEVTGILKDYNGTNEFDAGCTFVNAEKPAPVVPEAAEQFTASSVIESALSMSYTANGEEYSNFGNLALMLRLTFDYSAYENITETGLVVTKQSKEAAEAFVAGSTTVSSFIDADKDGQFVIRINVNDDEVVSMLDTKLYFAGYVVVDGETYVSAARSISFRELLETYANSEHESAPVAAAALAYWDAQ